MVGLYEHNGVVYRLLISDEMGVWLIDYANPRAPFCVGYEEFSQMIRIIPPPNDTIYSEKAKCAGERRFEAIKSLVEDNVYIADKRRRRVFVGSLAASYGVSERTMLQWYYDYLAGGIERLYPIPRQMVKKPLTANQKNMRWAINKYYFSSRRLSLRGAYDMMLLEKYMDETGALIAEYPTFWNFRHFYYSRARNAVKKVISREGIAEYQRNYRPLYGSAASGKEKIGIYQMDATIADIYLVSRHNRKQIIGRPYVYLAVDTVSRLVAGVYIGLEAGEEAVTECLRQAASDKVMYCKTYGIDIKSEDWPSYGLPSEIITDRGREFIGKRMESVCAHYGIMTTGLPPYRPDLKGLVENTLHALQERYKYTLKHMGVIEEDFQERGAPDYRREATLNLFEFTQVMIYAILYYNAKHIQSGFMRTPEMAENDVNPVSSAIWQWYAQNSGNGLIVASDGNYNVLLPRATAHFTRRGLAFCHLTYRNDGYHTRCASAGLNGKEAVQIAYEPQYTDHIYLLENGEYIKFTLTSAKEQFRGSTYAEVKQFLDNERQIKKALEVADTEGRVSTAGSIREIAIAARAERGGLHDMDAVNAIERHRESERGAK